MDLNNFEKPIIRKDYEALSKEVQEHKDKSVEAEPSDKEAVRAVLGEHIQQGKITQTQQSGDNPLPNYLNESTEDIQNKVKELVGVALEKGINESINQAQKQGPFILDALHDALTTKVYEELKQKGKLR